jgi:hypothetical protein
MAKPKSQPKSPQESRPDLLEAAFTHIADVGWAGWSPKTLAATAGYGLGEVYDAFPVPSALAQKLAEHLDKAMLAMPADELDGLSHRERLFELFMRRFDAMAPFKPGLQRLAREARGEPELLLASLCTLDRMAHWLIELAELPYSGLEARLARRALMLAYARLFRVWLDDDTPDLATTMAELDKRLDQLERAANLGDRLFAGFGRRTKAA